MASYGSRDFYATDHDHIRFSWETIGQSTAGNYSTVKWKLELVSYANGKIISSTTKNWNVTVNGIQYQGKNSIAIGNNETITLAMDTTNISHNEDGTKTFSYSFSQEFNITFGGSHIGTVTGSSVATLNTIGRKSLLAVGGGMLGEPQQLTVTKMVATNTHTITYKCGSLSGTIVTKSGEEKIMWTPPVELATQAPSANSVAVTLTMQTYTGEILIGTDTEVISCSIPYTGTFVPVLMPSISDATDNYNKFAGFVQGQSKLKVDIETYGAYGAWITSCKTMFDGATYNGTSVETNAITQSGELYVIITVTDSRGRTSESRTTVQVQEYSLPKVTSLTATRCNADGTVNPKGEHLLVKFSAKLSSINGNTAKYYIGYKKVSEENHTAVELTDLANQYEVNSSYVVPADPNSSHTIIFTAIDLIGQARTITTGSPVKKVWSALKKNGEIVGMAFGKVAEHEGVFDIGWPVKFSGGGDCVVEYGESNGWKYRKWDSGLAECWKILEFSTTINTQFGSLYCGNATQRQNYPFPFVEKPVETVTLQSGSTQAFLYAEASGYGVNGTNASARYNVFRPGAMATSQTFYLSFYVTGKWK